MFCLRLLEIERLHPQIQLLYLRRWFLPRHYADRYLADTRMPLSTIAYKLGFSDQASFTRAYRSWTGRTPGQTRRRI